MDISKALRCAIAEKNIKQQDLAIKAEISKQTISDICNGKTIPTMRVLSNIAEAMDMDLSQLIALGE